MDRRRSLSELDHRVLDHIGRLRFVTATHLAYWCDVVRVTIDRRLERLLTLGLVKAEKTSRPFIFFLTSAGAVMTGRPPASGGHQASWSVMAHACHAVELEIQLHQDRGFRLLDRMHLLRQGFNPAHGEHAGVDRTRQSTFVLLDDYGMQSDRIAHVWQRRHTPNNKYWPDPTGRVWGEVVHRYVVATTDPVQAQKHRAFIEDRGVVADVVDIKALWS